MGGELTDLSGPGIPSDGRGGGGKGVEFTSSHRKQTRDRRDSSRSSAGPSLPVSERTGRMHGAASLSVGTIVFLHDVSVVSVGKHRDRGRTGRSIMPGPWQVGDRIADRFEVFDVHRGGMGIVYLA